MPSITFRFTTECELTLEGKSYEEAYLKFRDLCHGKSAIEDQLDLQLLPPESNSVYFEIDGQQDFNHIKMLKGDFREDILKNCPLATAKRLQPRTYH